MIGHKHTAACAGRFEILKGRAGLRPVLAPLLKHLDNRIVFNNVS